MKLTCRNCGEEFEQDPEDVENFEEGYIDNLTPILRQLF